MAERSNAAVLKTVDGQLSRGSNPFLSATHWEAYASLFVWRRERVKRNLVVRARSVSDDALAVGENPSRVGKVPLTTRYRAQL